ncbi:MAG: MFS transporter [Bacteroidales bacterium]|nr:MFS transporter [Bacteroidales bacterium]
MNAPVKYPAYRFLILAVFMLITIAIEIQWLSHAAVARPAGVFYAGQFNPDSFLNIDFLAMVYMLVFLVMSFPASYIIDTFGIRTGLQIGASLLGAFSLLKAIFAANFTMVVVAQTGLAVAQPFILNAVTALTVRWFPLNERAMAAGFSALAQYIGIVLAMLVTPMLIGSDPSQPGYGAGFEDMLWLYAAIGMGTAALFLIFIKETPKGITLNKGERASFGGGLKLILGNRNMMITIFLFLIGLGIFNAISSMTDSISAHMGVKDSDGLIGGLMLIGGIIGAIVIPTLSDFFRKRRLFLVICLAGMVPGVAGLAFAPELSQSADQVYTLALVSAFILGFFVMSAGPVGFQYAAEVSYPAPESTSQGILLWIGQLTGMIFVLGMSVKNCLYLGKFMIAFSILALISFIVVFFLKESPFMKKARPIDPI